MLNYDALVEAMENLEEDTMVEILNGVMAEGGTEASKAMEACQKGMDKVGKLFEEGEYFVGDLIYAGELMTQAVEILKDGLIASDADGAAKTKMVLCTVKDDLHDIGKNIVKAMLEAAGFDVIDLGIDVPAEKIVETAKRTGSKVSGPIPLPTDREIVTILRAVHKYKDSREQFEMRTHKRLIDILRPSNKTVEALTGLELPAGVEIEIKL